VVGIPGAATVGSAVAMDFTPSAMAAGAGTLLAASADDGTLRVLKVHERALESRVVEGAIAAPDRIVLSPSARAALLCDSKSAVLQVITGLPDQPAAGRELRFAELPNANAWKLAVSDDGARFAIGSGASIWLAETGGNRTASRLQTDVGMVAFRPDSAEAVALLSDGVVVRITAAGAEAVGQIAGAAGLDAVGLQVSPDGKRAFVAYAQGSLAVVEAGAPETALTNCGCKPAALIQANRTALYRLNELSDSPLLFWDVSPPVPRLWFVPAGNQGEEE
jgi:hypothetical protein